jgi:SAM-dependent methyltransferase
MSGKHTPKVTLSIPNQGNICAELSEYSIMLATDGRYELSIDFRQGGPIDSNRNKIIRDFLKHEDQEYLIMIDSDNPPFFSNNILDLIELDKDIMICPTPMWKGSLEKLKSGKQPFMFNTMVEIRDKGWAENPYPGGLKEIDAGGSGCIVIARRVLEKVKPAFSRIYDEDGIAKVGSDFLFCKRAKEVGFSIWAHYDYVCHHYKRRDMTEMWRYIMLRDLSQMNFVDDKNTNECLEYQLGETEDREHNFYDKIVELCAGKRVMDFGCGRGTLMKKLKETATEVFGVDISQRAIDQIREEGMFGEVGTDPFAPDPINSKWDVITCTEVLEYLDDDKGMLNKFFEYADTVIYSVPNNCFPPSVEPKHKRVYTYGYIYHITPYFREIIDYGNYVLVIASKEKYDGSIHEPVSREERGSIQGYPTRSGWNSDKLDRVVSPVEVFP